MSATFGVSLNTMSQLEAFWNNQNDVPFTPLRRGDIQDNRRRSEEQSGPATLPDFFASTGSQLFEFGDDEGIEEKHVPINRNNGLLKDFADAMDENEMDIDLRQGRILDLSVIPRPPNVVLIRSPCINAIYSFVSSHSPTEIMAALSHAMAAIQAEMAMDSDAMFSYEVDNEHFTITGRFSRDIGPVSFLKNDSISFSIFLLRPATLDPFPDDMYVIELKREYGEVIAFSKFYRNVLLKIQTPVYNRRAQDVVYKAGLTDVLDAADALDVPDCLVDLIIAFVPNDVQNVALCHFDTYLSLPHPSDIMV